MKIDAIWTIRLECGLDRLWCQSRTWLRGCVIAGLTLVVFGLLPGPRAARGQTAPANPSAVDQPTKTLQSRLDEARANLAAAQAGTGAGLTNAPAGVAAQDLLIRQYLLERLVRLYEQQLSLTAELEATQARKAELVREAQTWTRFAEPLPYSILLADRLREELEAERLKVSNGEASTTLLDKLIEENRGELTKAEEKIRQLNEQLEGVRDREVAARLSWQRELERLRSQVASASLGMFDAERLVRQESVAASRVLVDLLQRQLIIAEAGAKFTQADLDQVTTRLDREQAQLDRELVDAQTKRTAAYRALAAARAEGAPATTPAAALVPVREAELEAADTAIYVLRLLREGGSLERTIWELRFAAHNSPSPATLRTSEQRLAVLTGRLKLWWDYARQQLDVSASQIELHKTRMNSLAADAALQPVASARLAALRERDQLLLRLVRSLERWEGLTQRWAEGLRAAQRNLPFTGRVRNLFSSAHSFVSRLWSFEVFTVEDTITVDGRNITGKRSVTISKIVTAILILVVGYWATGWIARRLESLLGRRFNVEANLAKLFSRWVRAVLVVCLVVFSLVSVKIPLTVFAFAGGALAIGLGLGMQTLLKNLVCGIIILFERPFHIGDVLDVGGQQGRVTSVGLRASVLQLWDGTETLIPNSTLLESNLTNWTYSNRLVRFTVAVGVAYGSDLRLVTQVLNEAVDRHGLVEKEPKPQVLFTNFGDNALLFELRYWLDITKAVAPQVASDLRLMIEGAFASHGIVIAFPQRDVHLAATRPLQVEVVPPGPAKTENKAPSVSKPDPTP